MRNRIYYTLQLAWLTVIASVVWRYGSAHALLIAAFILSVSALLVGIGIWASPKGER